MPVVLVGGAAAVVTALCVVLLILAALALGQWLKSLLPDWHIPGLGSIASYVWGGITSGVAIQLAQLDHWAAPAAQFVRAPIVVLRTWLTTITGFAFSVTSLMHRILFVQLPEMAAKAVRDLLYWVSLLKAEIAAVAAKAVADLLYWVSLLKAEITAVAAKAVADLLYWVSLLKAAILAAEAKAVTDLLYWVSLIKSAILAAEVKAVSDLLYWVSLLKAEIAGTVAVLRSEAATLYRSALAYADRAAAAAWTAGITALDRVFSQTIAVPWREVVTGVEGSIAVADKDFTDVVNDLRSIDLSVPQDLVGGLAAVTAATAALLKLTRDCTMPNCRNLSQVGRDLQELFGVAEDLAFLSVIVEAARDPKGFATEAASVLTTVVDGAERAARDLIGV